MQKYSSRLVGIHGELKFQRDEGISEKNEQMESRHPRSVIGESFMRFKDITNYVAQYFLLICILSRGNVNS